MTVPPRVCRSVTLRIATQWHFAAQNSITPVRPSAKTSILLGVVGESLVVCIDVASKQPEPVYYHDHRPMIRDLRQSRPATPDEVKDRIWSHPSSEAKRNYEDLKLQHHRNIIDGGRQLNDDLAAPAPALHAKAK